MKTMTYSESRARYAEVLNAVTDDREEIVITRAGHEKKRAENRNNLSNAKRKQGLLILQTAPRSRCSWWR